MECACAICHLWPVLLYNIFATHPIKGRIFEKKKKATEHKICVSNFSTTFVRKNFHSKKNWARYDQKCTLLLMWSPILTKLQFSRSFSKKKFQIPNLTKICPVRAELYHADRRTGMTKLIVAFRNFANAPNKTQFNLCNQTSAFEIKFYFHVL